MEFGEVVERHMRERGMSQAELARKMNTGRQTINSIIKGGRRGPSLDTAIEVANALGVSLQDLIDEMRNGEGNPKSGREGDIMP